MTKRVRTVDVPDTDRKPPGEDIESARASPAFAATDEQRALVAELAGHGLPQDQIARILRVAPMTLRKYFREELDLGEAQATARVAKTLYEKAIAGDTACMIFWMKARAKWSERTTLQHVGEDGGPIKVQVDADRRSFVADMLARHAATASSGSE